MNRNILFSALVATFAVGCYNPGIVDRTQPNYTKKSDLLDGQWYYKNTIVGSPNTASGARVGFGGQLEKIRFEIQEILLVGYRTRLATLGCLIMMWSVLTRNPFTFHGGDTLTIWLLIWLSGTLPLPMPVPRRMSWK